MFFRDFENFGKTQNAQEMRKKCADNARAHLLRIVCAFFAHFAFFKIFKIAEKRKNSVIVFFGTSGALYGDTFFNNINFGISICTCFISVSVVIDRPQRWQKTAKHEITKFHIFLQF